MIIIEQVINRDKGIKAIGIVSSERAAIITQNGGREIIGKEREDLLQRINCLPNLHKTEGPEDKVEVEH